MHKLRALHSLRFARLLTLVGLLCVAGLQLHEAGHWQDATDSSSHCLVCKSASAIAVGSAPALHLPQFAAVAPQADARAAFPSVAHSGFLARGPPHAS